MSNAWICREVPIKFQLSDKTLFVRRVLLHVRQIGLNEPVIPIADPRPPADSINKDSQGFLVRSLPVTAVLPTIRKTDGYYRYVPSQYKRYYINLTQSFEQYKQQFSSKTRSTILRKVKKFEEQSGDSVIWKAFKTPAEMEEFFRLARVVSAKTYQEKLLDAGLPDSADFIESAKRLAAEGRIRSFILFDGDRPVSYLYCPVHDDVLIYQYLGYDPDYAKLSVGTVLQWLSLRSLFDEALFRIFDFTEGESEHKRLFATDSVQCANVFFMRANLQNRVLLMSQIAVDNTSKNIGEILDRCGIKAQVKKLIRFGK